MRERPGRQSGRREWARQAEVGAAGERAKQDAAAMRLGDAIEQHAKLAELESEARHLARASDLLGRFP